MQPVFECQSKQQGLSSSEIKKIANIMRKGGLCILPSDSSYVLTGLSSISGITDDINSILARNNMQMSVCFNSLQQAHKYVEFSNLAYMFMEKLTPGGLTFIARPNNLTLRRFLSRLYIDDGTIGVRISESLSELQLAACFPIPSTPIRDCSLHEVGDADQAFDIVAQKMAKYQINRDIILIRGSVLHLGELSTVVREIKVDGLLRIQLLRRGIIPIEVIQKVASDCFYDGIVLSD